MKNRLLLFVSLAFLAVTSNAQTTAMQFSGVDCNSNPVDLFADLNAGKAVVLFYYMPNCGSCPPPATRIQTMANNIMNTYPGMVTGYAFPFQNTTTCSYSASWVSTNNLTFYAPMDSGATQVAYYGGFGMPTVVLLGGTDHRVMWSTQSFSTSDTTIMRDSILNLFGATGLDDMPGTVSSINAFPNPANMSIQLEVNMTQPAQLKIEVVNILGETVAEIYNSQASPGLLRKEISTEAYSNGTYFMRITSGGEVVNHKFTIAH